jgi:hypothetical protein
MFCILNLKKWTHINTHYWKNKQSYIIAKNDMPLTTRMWSYCLEDRVSFLLFDLTANFSGSTHESLLRVNHGRKPSFREEVAHGLTREGCKLKMFLVRLFISSKFHIKFYTRANTPNLLKSCPLMSYLFLSHSVSCWCLLPPQSRTFSKSVF